VRSGDDLYLVLSERPGDREQCSSLPVILQEQAKKTKFGLIA
jgi:hypothetical protein